MKIEIENASLPEVYECKDRRGADEFVWQGNRLLLSETFRSEVKKNASRGMHGTKMYQYLRYGRGLK